MSKSSLLDLAFEVNAFMINALYCIL